MKIVDAKVIITCPGPQLRHVEDHDGRRRPRARRRHAQRPRAGRGGVPDRARDPVPDRTRRAAHRGHLAVSLQRRVLAARPGDDERDQRRRHGALGHQGQDAERARLRAARRTLARQRAGLQPRERQRHRDDRRRRRGAREAGLHRDSRAERHPRSREHVRRRERAIVRTSPPNAGFRPRASGAARSTSRSCRRCSSDCATSSATTCTCCTTSITGLRRSRRRGWGSRSSRITCSGWRIRSRQRRRKACGWCASTRRRQSRSAKCSTRSTTAIS